MNVDFSGDFVARKCRHVERESRMVENTEGTLSFAGRDSGHGLGQCGSLSYDLGFGVYFGRRLEMVFDERRLLVATGHLLDVYTALGVLLVDGREKTQKGVDCVRLRSFGYSGDFGIYASE